ncbi:MAG: pilus assembly protein [Ardenticatenaceae bacterium]|nr:pilus assembly protein [Ardenticatenaceae bacterium]
MVRQRAVSGGFRGEQGQDLVEYALILPLLLLLLLGIMEFGIVIFSYDTIANAAREGARVGIIPANSTADVQNAAMAMTSGLDPGALSISVARSGSCSGPDSVKVVVTYDVKLISGVIIQALGGTSTIRLSTEATMQCEP